MERKFPGTFVYGSESSHWELSLLGAKILESEKSLNQSKSSLVLTLSYQLFWHVMHIIWLKTPLRMHQNTISKDV